MVIVPMVMIVLMCMMRICLEKQVVMFPHAVIKLSIAYSGDKEGVTVRTVILYTINVNNKSDIKLNIAPSGCVAIV